MVLSLVIAGAVEGAEPHEASLHAPLVPAASLTLGEVVQATLARYPDAAELSARLEQAQAWRARSARLLSDAPSLSFRYQTDRWTDGEGLREYEGGVELSLWRRGERRAARALADALTAQSGAAESALRWQVAGLVRALLWDMADAEQSLSAAEDAGQITRRLAAAVKRRHELGDVPLGDVLLSRSAALAAEEAVVAAHARLVDAQREFAVLTALQVRPPYRPETLADSTVVGPDHPALALAQAELEGARAQVMLTRRRGRGTPTLTIGPRWERAALANTYDESIGITFKLPIPGTAHARTAVADVRRDAAAAQAHRDRLVRALELARHEAAHGLEVARQNLATARQRAELARRHAELGRSAYEQGEMDLMDLLRLQESAVAAGRQLTLLEVDVHRQTAMYNQAVGVMP